MKKFYASLAALTLAISGILLLNVVNGTSQAMPRDCDSNAIMKCGAANSSELKNKYGQNATGDLDDIYKAYGLSDSDLKNAGSRAKMGVVHKDGRVTVNGETVATNAKTIGRHNMTGSSKKVIGGKTYYERSPSVSFGSESISAFVFFDENGEFRAAVITSCGNPVVAAPKPKPSYACNGLTENKISRTEYSFTASASARGGATVTGYAFDFGDGKSANSASKTVKHTYEKAGTYTIKVTAKVKVGSSNKTVTDEKCQVRITVTPPPVTPSYVCDSLEATKISRMEYSFDGKATAENGAEILGYTFDFGDGKQQTTENATGVKHTYEKDGEYTVTMLVTAKIGNETKTVGGENCKAHVTVVPPEECKPGIPIGDVRCTPPEECKPGIPVGDERCTPCEVPGKEHLPKDSPECVETPETPAELPRTGTGSLIGGTLGLGSMVTALGYYIASRRGLLSTLLNR